MNTDETLPTLQAQPDLMNNYEDHFLKAIEIEPKNALFRSEYAMFLFWVKEDIKRSYIMFQQAIELDPTNPDIYCEFCSVFNL